MEKYISNFPELKSLNRYFPLARPEVDNIKEINLPYDTIGRL